MQTRPNTQPSPRVGSWIFRILYLGIIIIGLLYWMSLRNESAELDRTLEKIGNTPIIEGKAKIGDAQVVIPSKDFFSAGEMWSLTSKKHPLHQSFIVRDLVDSPVATGGDEDLRVSKRIAKPLSALIAAAKADGYELMISSAYRSIADQQVMYDSYVTRYGEAMAKEYVAPPGASEHHTGLAVDISEVSDECKQDSDKCSLGTSSAAWIEENGPRYGFILRYPEGKKDTTGVSYEWWHFRYVGVPLAKAVAAGELTLDEAIDQMQTVSARE